MDLHTFSPANRTAHGSLRRVPFPHMGPQDTRIWRLALLHGLMPADRYEYDVKLGGQAASLVPAEHPQSGMWVELMRKRVDVVAWRSGVPWLIEVKGVASFSALGQCIGYRSLWWQERGRQPAPVAACVCAVTDPDLVRTYDENGVRMVPLSSDLVELALRP